MKSQRVLLAAGALTLGLLTGAAIAGVTGTPHQFAGPGSSAAWNTTGELCKPCHIPHTADITIGTLWNHAYQDSSAFTLYDPTGELGPQSLVCLGCHDGQTALDAFAHHPGGPRVGAPGNVMTGDAVIGVDLTDDHPVGVEYPGGSRFAPIGSIWGTHPGIAGTYGNIPLYDDLGVDQIECASCHTPHDNDNGDFLRIKNNDNAQPSALCVTCHITHE